MSNSDLHVRATRIIGTDTVVFSVWEPSDLGGNHSTVMTDLAPPAKWWGRVGTRRLPADIDAIRDLDQRIPAVDKFHELQYAEAYAAILAYHPAATGGRGSMGEITLADPNREICGD